MIYPEFLEKAFESDYSIVSDEINHVFRTQLVGDLKVQEGKILACDPFTFQDDQVFTAQFPIGDFPVELAIADIDTDERICFARIKFSEQQPVRWGLALLEDQEDNLAQGEIYGYGVDSGTGCFIDNAAYKEYMEMFNDDEEYYDELLDAMEDNYEDTRSWLLWDLEESNMAVFSTGYGDGLYQTYIGYDSTGAICRLVTDFGILDWPE